MTTLFGILETGSRALFAQQTGLAVTGNNIANVNTPGYSRQRANLVTMPEIDIPPVPLGQGVRVASIERYRSVFLDRQIRNESSYLGFYESMVDIFGQMQTVFSDPITAPASQVGETAEAGLNTSLIRFFESFQELSLEPESTAVRAAVRETAITLSSTFNQMDRQLSDLRADLNRQLESSVNEINALLDSILEVNMQISRLELEPSANANNLRDQRDLLITQLSRLVPVTATEQANGAVNVSIFGINAVQMQSVNHLLAQPRGDDPAGTVDILFENGGGQVLNNQIRSGELGALLQAREQVIPQFQDALDELARTLIEQVNAIHSGSAGLKGFEELTGTLSVSDPATLLESAGLEYDVQAGSFDLVVRDANGDVVNTYTIAVDPATDDLNALAAAIDAADGVVGGGDLVASVNASNQLVIGAGANLSFTFQGDSSGVVAALGLNTFFSGTDARTIALSQLIQDDPAYIAASADGTPGNNESALLIAQLRDAQILSGGTADFNEFYQGMVASLGTQARRMIQLEANTSLLVDSLEIRQEEIAGVSLDEETVKMLEFQRAFTAASRFITSVDEMIETVVERMGIVGR